MRLLLVCLGVILMPTFTLAKPVSKAVPKPKRVIGTGSLSGVVKGVGNDKVVFMSRGGKTQILSKADFAKEIKLEPYKQLELAYDDKGVLHEVHKTPLNRKRK